MRGGPFGVGRSEESIGLWRRHVIQRAATQAGGRARFRGPFGPRWRPPPEERASVPGVFVGPCGDWRREFRSPAAAMLASSPGGLSMRMQGGLKTGVPGRDCVAPSSLPAAPCGDWRWEFRSPAGSDAGLKTGVPGRDCVAPSSLPAAPCGDWRREFRSPAGSDAGLKTGAPGPPPGGLAGAPNL